MRNLHSGILIIDKPKGWTSHDVVNKVRKVFNVKRVGHAGTLDPAATGVLIVMVGKKATRLSRKLMAQEKEYVVEIEFGKSTTTGDEEGKILGKLEVSDQRLEISKKDVEAVLTGFVGEIEQRVPFFSAVKVQGKKLYEFARQKIPHKIERPVRTITIHQIELLDFSPVTKKNYLVAKLRVVCSKGTYTRVLAEDIGKALGLPAYQKSLRRTRVGEFSLDQAISLEELEKVSDPKEALIKVGDPTGT